MPLLCILFSFLFWYIFNFINLCKFLLKKLIRLLASSFPKFWISTSSFCLSYIVCIVSVSISTFYLGCTDAAKRPPHLRPTHKGRLCLRIRAASSFFFFCFTTCVDTRKIRSIRTNQGQIGPYRSQPPIPTPTGQFNPKFKKKKKRCETHHLAEIIIKGAKRTVWTKTTKPYIIFSPQLSHFSLLIFSSLSLFGLSSLCSTPRLAASALRLPSLTQSHSHTHTISLTSSATHSQVSSSSINLKLSILVFHSSHML